MTRLRPLDGGGQHRVVARSPRACVGAGANPEALYGMLAPLVVAVASWVVVERT